MPFLHTFSILLLQLLLATQIEADQTTEGLTVRLFYDYDCKNKSGILNPASGGAKCHQLEGPTPNSFTISEQTGQCSVVFYGDPVCSFNATRAPIVNPLGSCTSSDHLLSFAIECGPDASNSLKDAASSQTISSQTGSSAPIPASTSEAAPPPPEHSPAPGSSNNGGLSTSGTIAIGVVLPAVSIIVAIIFGIRMWNSGFNSRKANGFTELAMDNRAGNLPTPPSAPPLKPDGFTECEPLPLKTNETCGKPVYPYGLESPPPNPFGTPPRYKTNDPMLMSSASIERPWEEQGKNEHGNHSIEPTGFAELSTSNYPATRRGTAELSTSSSEGFATTSLFAPQPSRGTDSHSPSHGQAIELPLNPRVGTGQFSAPRVYTELPVNTWEGHNSSDQKGSIAELPSPPPARWR